MIPEPKISIIVPVYNVEKYLEKCLDSLVNQTFEEIEILVVNDGSTDDSQIIIDQFVNRFPHKIISLKKENGGLSDARNFGIDRARGEFLAFVDSDDFVNVEMMADMYGLAIKNDADIVVCNLQKVDENGNVTQRLSQLAGFPEKIILKDNLSVFSDISYFACNKIFKKSLFHGMRFAKGMHFEDIELIPKLVLKSNVIAFSAIYHYQYLERIDSISKTHTEKGLDILKAVENVKKFFHSSQYSNNKDAIKNFMILEGVYTFLAYLAFVKNESTFEEMSAKLSDFCENNNLKLVDIFLYKRFDKNYLLYLPLGKKIYYLLYLLGFKRVIRKLIARHKM